MWVAMCSGLAWKSHSCSTIWQLAHTTPPSQVLSACLRGVVSLPRFRCRQLRGRISKDSGRRRRHGRASPAQGRWLAIEHTTQRRAPDDAIATGLKPDLLPRSGLCSPSPMAQAQPSMASDASFSQSAWRRSLTSTWLLSFSRDQGCQGCQGALSLTLPPARVAPPAASLALQSAGNAHVDRWRVTFTPTGWQASHRVQPDSQIGPLPRPKFSKAVSSNGTTVLWARSLCTPLTALTVRSTKQSGTYGRNS